MKWAVIVGVCLGAAACGPNLADIPSQDFGYPPTGDTSAAVRAFMVPLLKDADSARYRKVGGPVKGWTREALITGGHLEVGWAECYMINAKNSFGGYVGFKSYLFLFREGQLVGFSPNPQLSSWNCF